MKHFHNYIIVEKISDRIVPISETYVASCTNNTDHLQAFTNKIYVSLGWNKMSKYIRTKRLCHFS